MAFWDAQHGLAISDSVDGRFVIVRTDDGGRSWTPSTRDGLPPALPGEGAFAASGTSVAVYGTQTRLDWHRRVVAARVLRTADGGRTWSVATTPLAAGPSAGIFSVAFADAQRGIVVGGDFKRESDPADSAARTVDGGATWTRVEPAGLSGFRSAVAWVPPASRPRREPRRSRCWLSALLEPTCRATRAAPGHRLAHPGFTP